MTQVQKIQEELAANGFTSKVWSKAGHWRVYLEAGRKDATVYLDLDSDGEGNVTGASLKVFVDAGRQSPAWARTQNQIVRERFTRAFNCYVRAMYSADQAEDGSGYGPDIRAMIAEAYAA